MPPLLFTGIGAWWPSNPRSCVHGSKYRT
jgi:hypothetical protein